MNNAIIQDQLRLRLLKILAVSSGNHITQRDLAEGLGISLGKTNSYTMELVQKGFIDVQKCSGTKNKKAQKYFLTPTGMEEKTRLTVKLLRRKMREYEDLKHEIEELSCEIEST